MKNDKNTILNVKFQNLPLIHGEMLTHNKTLYEITEDWFLYLLPLAFYEHEFPTLFQIVPLTVSTPALNIEIEFALISRGVSSPFMMRYVSRGTAITEEDAIYLKRSTSHIEKKTLKHFINTRRRCAR